MDNETHYYRHVYHILSSKVARLPGLPLVTIPQGVAAVGGLSIAMMNKSIILAFILPAVGFLALSMHQGEFAILRLFSVLYAAVLVRVNKPQTVSLDTTWQMTTGKKEDGRPAAIYRLPGASMVTDTDTD
ncbi:MAG: hypothetical protein GY803_10265 [Chloroflexi bacterium]|nr:hypothetical protein [Chloroflexota bacterium]